MKNIKIWIVITTIIIIIITIVLLYIVKNYLAEQQRIETGIDNEDELIVNIDIVDKKIKYVDDRNEYFAVEKCIQKYLQKIVVQDKEAVYNLLDSKYIEENNIDIDNVLENIEENGKYEDEIILSINDMYTIKNENDLCVYFVYGEIAETYESDFKNFYIMVRLDKTNDSFSILPHYYMQKHGYLNLDIGYEVNEEFTSIEKNDYNEYTYEIIDDEDMATAYYYNYINKMQYNTLKAYETLDAQYKEKRFTTFDKFNEYVKNTTYIRMNSYTVKEYEDYKQYICEDVYGREYIFKETDIMQYTAILDSYTLENETQRQAYAKNSNQNRALYNIDKFFRMLNMQDYDTAYSILDESFKENNFRTQQDFENYIKQNVFKYNKVTYKEYSNKISSLHIYNIEISDFTEQTQTNKNITVIVKLLEDMNFAISFEI